MTDPRLPFELGRVGLENTAFEGENDAYVHGTEPDATTALVDTGVALPETREQLRETLAARGIEFADVEEVCLTHWHDDHSGLAGDQPARRRRCPKTGTGTMINEFGVRKGKGN